MDWAAYFEKTSGVGILGTADSAGNVDMAIYARPHVIDHATIAFIMRPRLSYQNLRNTTKAAYMFIEKGDGYHGHRLYLTKLREETDQAAIEKLRRTHHEKPGDSEQAHLVYFRIDTSRPLVGDNQP
jgi:hypothetical protein